jgi:hypothetical protein
MPARGSFQKRQKEAARREKRQLKLDRRQGRQAGGTHSPPVSKKEEPADSADAVDTTSITSSELLNS